MTAPAGGLPSLNCPNKVGARVFEVGFYCWICGCNAKGMGYMNRERCEAAALKHGGPCKWGNEAGVFYGTMEVSRVESRRVEPWPAKKIVYEVKRLVD